MSKKPDQKLASTHPANTQSMKIAAQLLQDTLKYLYHIEDAKVIWGVLDEHTSAPAFQYSFPKTDHNLIGAGIFARNFLDTKTQVTHGIDTKNNIIAFQGLIGVSIFMREFMIQNNLIPNPALFEDKPDPRENNFISEKDLLTLKKPFYISVNDCVRDADIANEYPFYDTSLFVFSHEHLEKSVNMAKISAEGKNSNHTTDMVFYFH